MVRYGKRDKRVALYLRVSTGEQTTRNQRRELEAAVRRHDWKVAHIFEDADIGAKGRQNRPGLDAMLRAVARREVFQFVTCELRRSFTELSHVFHFPDKLWAGSFAVHAEQAVE